MAFLISRAAARLSTVISLLLLALPADSGPLPLWELEAGNNRVLLMGSVHFLRPTDYPLREGLQQAFELADTVVMEINMSTIDQAAMQSALTRMTLDPEGRDLRQLMGEQDFREASRLAEDLGIPLAMFEQFEPWFAALSITQLRMVQLGFDPSWGVEARLTRRALSENKTLDGLETTEEQLGFMDRLDNDTQRQFLLQSLQDAVTVQNEVETLVNAWARGDTDTLRDSLLQGLEDVPALYDAILVQRNRNWATTVAGLLDRTENYLVVVGAMHLVGDDSLLAMLEAKGIRARQLSDKDFTKP